jgi:ABC-type sugar transport system, periplasmic component
MKKVAIALAALALLGIPCFGQAAIAKDSGDNPYAKLNLSKPVEINLTMLGSKPIDFDKVIALVNDKLKKKINVKLDVTFIPLADYATKYQLILAGGEDIDLVYAAPWCFFQDEVRKGAFMELTKPFLAKYMPVTNQVEAPAAWKQIAVNGKIFAVPRNESDFDMTYGAIIRGDLRKKYHIPPLKSVADFENYCQTIAKNEKSGIFAFNLFPSFPVSNVMLSGRNNFLSPATGYAYVWDLDKGAFKSDDVQFAYDTPEFREYALMMAKWAKAGFWPANAIANSTHTNDLFIEGKSAADLGHYKTADKIIKECAKNGITDVEFYNIFDKNIRVQRSPYYNDSCAIAASSKNPERAAITLDVLKNDKEINLLLIGGIEGKHYILNADGTHSDGPDAANYPWDGWTWFLRNEWNPMTGGMDKMVKDVRSQFEAIELKDGIWPCDGFVFDDTSVKAEQAVVNSIVNEYKFSFDLGGYGDKTEATIDKMMGELKAAGLGKVTAEFKSQLKKYTGK